MTDLIVALDLPSALEARGLFNTLARETEAAWFKVGPRVLLTPGAVELCGTISDRAHLFLDLKLYDTADTVAAAARAAFDLGARFITVHAAPRMLEAAQRAKTREDQKVVAVGPLTDGGGLPITGWNFDGLICSVAFVRDIQRYDHSNLRSKILVCPGIRRAEINSPDNHIAPATPAEAREAGADFVVVGRPITTAPDPVTAARTFLKELR